MSAPMAPAESTPERHLRSPGAGILALHPMRERIVKAILEQKQTTREIAAWVVPHVTHVTVARLRQHVLAELAAATSLHKARQIQSVAEIIGANSMSPEKVTELAIGGGPHLSRVFQHQKLVDRKLEKLGDDAPVEAITALINTDLKGVRLAAELDGTMARVAAQFAAPAVQNNLQVVILPGSMPTETLEAPALEATSTPLPDAD